MFQQILHRATAKRTFAISIAAFGLLGTCSRAEALGFTVSGATVTVASGATLQTEGDINLQHGQLDATGAQIRLGADWNRTAGASFIATGSTVTFEGAANSSSALTGSTTFYSLQSTVGGKLLIFPSGSTQTVSGLLDLRGALNNTMFIRSSTDGAYAYLVNSGSNTVYYVNVQDNNAGGGNTITARANSTDSGHNVNWFFSSSSGFSDVPKRPSTIRGISANGGADIRLEWRPVTTDVSGQAVVISSYSVQRSTALFGTYTTVASVTSGATYSEPFTTSVSFYRVVAIDAAGNHSAASDNIDSSSDLNRYVLPNDNTQSHIRIPDVSNAMLQRASDGSEDIELTLERRTSDETGGVLLSYGLDAWRVSSSVQLPGFSFMPTGMAVQLDPSSLSVDAETPIALFWVNGSHALRLSTPVTAGSATEVESTTQNSGRYQVRVAQSQSHFSLQDGSPFPRVLTPNRANENRRLFFAYINPNNDPVSISIYDIRNRKVRDLDSATASAIPNSMVWDVRDDAGRVVPSGVYLYKVQAGDTTLTGTVVVAQ